MPMPAVTAAEVAELKRAGQATLHRRDATESRPHSLAEVLGLMIHEWRHHGAAQEDLLHDIELIVRSTDQFQGSIRAARDTLAGLGYEAAILRLLTRLARKAKPMPPWWASTGRARPRHRASVILRTPPTRYRAG
jgi:hypothetical protein